MLQKLARIVGTPLMEEPVPIRYAFLALTCLADDDGRVLGTDAAIARRLNMPIEEFLAAVLRLAHGEAPWITPTTSGRRGYQVDRSRRPYMRRYMRAYRARRGAGGAAA